MASIDDLPHSRRNFLAKTLSAAVFISGRMGYAQPKGPNRIDVHHHFVPDEYFAYLRRHNPNAMNAWSLSKDLEDMDRFGTATAMLSITQPAFNLGDRDEIRAIARASNEAAARLVKDKPGRFGNFAGIPLKDIDGSLKELEYSYDTLKADGLCLMTNYGDVWLGNQMFWPVYEEMNRRRAVVHVHPTAPNCCGNLPILKDGVPNEAAMIEFGTDTTRTIASLIFSGTAKRFPNISWIFSHAGGTMPFLIERFLQFGASAEIVPGITTTGQRVGISGNSIAGPEVLSHLRRFYYDTAQSSNPIALEALKKVVQVSQIVYGTDYWFRIAEDTDRGLRTARVFNSREIDAINRTNAERIMPQLKLRA